MQIYQVSESNKQRFVSNFPVDWQNVTYSEMILFSRMIYSPYLEKDETGAVLSKGLRSQVLDIVLARIVWNSDCFDISYGFPAGMSVRLCPVTTTSRSPCAST